MENVKILPSPDLYWSSYNEDLWEGANYILYSMCEEHPEHDHPETIFMKLILIGRSYAASVERRKTKQKGETTESFYRDRVIPEILNSELDYRLTKLKSMEENTIERVNLTLETHGYLMSIFKKITGDEKRSFCSKYLHFHLPQLFFIYDSRAEKGLRKFVSKFPDYGKAVFDIPLVDQRYASFYMKCHSINDFFRIGNIYPELSPRNLDKLLLKVADFETEIVQDPKIRRCLNIIK